MIKVTVELISANGPQHNKILGIAKICNDGTSTNSNIGNYTIELSKSRKASKYLWKAGELKGFKRKLFGGWDLLYLCLRSILKERHE